MLEVIAWVILALGALCGWMIARTRNGQAAVVLVTLVLGGMIFAQGQAVRSEVARAQRELDRAALDHALQPYTSRYAPSNSPAPSSQPDLSDPKVQAWLNRKVSPAEYEAALKKAEADTRGHRQPERQASED